VTLAYHELRSPLGLVATAARSLAEDCEDEAIRERCDTIVRAAERMLRVTSQVLAIARRDASEVDAETERFSPAEVVEQLAENFQRLDVPVVPRVEPAARLAKTEGVRGRFEALLQSLLTNAFDHAEPGTRINVTVGATADEVTVTVTNRIASRSRHDGIGAGMYLCRLLAEALPATLDAGPVDGEEFRAELRLRAA
jgi:signal transduction histidine kinase